MKESLLVLAATSVFTVAAPVSLDNFDTTRFQIIGAPSNGSPSNNPAVSSGATGDAIGGMRTITNTRTAPSGTADAVGQQVLSTVTNGTATVALGANTEGFSVFSYNAGGADLVDGTNNALTIEVLAADLSGVDYTFTIDGASSTKTAFGASILQFPFADFPGTDFTSVTNITLSVTGPPSFDTAFDTLQATLETATELLVTSNADSGAGSLRETIANAPALSRITFDPTVFNTETNRTITLTSGQLLISGKDLTIDASGVCGITLDGNENSRLFSVESSSSLTLDSFNLIRGNDIQGAGIAVRNTATLSVANSTFYDNKTPDAGGNSGGGLHNEGTAIVENCTFYRNFAWLGGAIQTPDGGNTTLRHCTIYDNTSTDIAGGITNGGTLSMENTVLANNTNNQGNNPNFSSSGPFTSLGGNFVSDNTGEIGKFPASTDIDTPNANGDYVGTSASPFDPGFITSGDAFGTVGYLANYGGPTLTLLPLPDSPLIDKGNPTTTPIPDQRGLATLALRDIGAVETNWDQFLSLTPTGSTKDLTLPSDNITIFPEGVGLFGSLFDVDKLIDNDSDLEFSTAADEVNVGFTITPSVGASQIQGLCIQSSDVQGEIDAVPSSFLILGSHDLNHFTPLISGPIPAFTGTSETKNIYFSRFLPSFPHYRVIFPQNQGNAFLSIGEVELLGTPTDNLPCITEVKLELARNESNEISEGALTLSTQHRSDRSYRILSGSSPDDLSEDFSFFESIPIEPFGTVFATSFDGNDAPTVLPKRFYRLEEKTEWQTETAALVAQNGRFPSLAISPSGFPAIAYRDAIGTLKYASFDGTDWESQTVETADINAFPALTFSPAGRPSISYSINNNTLRFATFDGSNWQIETVASSVLSVSERILYSSDGLPSLAYTDSNNHLIYSSFDGTNWNPQTIDTSDSAKLISLAIAPNSHPAIAFFDVDRNIKYTSFDGNSWQTETVRTADNFLGSNISLGFFPDGTPAFSYLEFNVGLRYTSRRDGSWQTQTIELTTNSAPNREAGRYPSLAFAPNGLPVISYRNGESGSNKLKLARFDGTDWSTEEIIAGGLDSSLVFTPEGLPAIAHMAFDGSESIWRLQVTELKTGQF